MVLCYMNTDSLLNTYSLLKTGDIYAGIAKHVEKIRFDTINYEIEIQLPKGKKNVVE